MEARASLTLAILGSLATVLLLVGTTFVDGAALILAAVALALLVGRTFARHHDAAPWALPVLVALGGGIAVFSVLTGFLNGLSDEPYSTPAYAGLGLALYSSPVHFTYVEYGRVLVENSYDVYLPLLTFVQVPGLDYRWVSVLAWAGTVYRFRRQPYAAAGFSTAWVPLLAANGQNDFVPLLALTWAIAVPPARGRWLVEVFALGLKQLANLVALGYHLARRQYGWALATLALTLAYLAPFLWLDPHGVYCHVLVGDPGTACVGHPWTFFVFKRNYWLYPTWLLLAFPLAFAGWVRRATRHLQPAVRPA